MQIRPNRAKKPRAAAPPDAQEVPIPPPSVKRIRPNKYFALLLVVFVLVAYWIWDQFLRTSAYAVVQVQETQLSAPLSGVIESMSIKEDGRYEAGTPAFTVVDRETKDELETLELRLRLIESQMLEKGMNLKLDQADRLYERDRQIGDTRAELEFARVEEARLSADIALLSAELPLLKYRLERLERFEQAGAASEDELLAARSEYEASNMRISELIKAREAALARVEALRAVVNRPVPESHDLDSGVEPLRREAALVRRQIEQVRERLLQSRIRLPVPGRITRIIHRPGEYVAAGDPVITVVSPSSMHVVAYFDQGETSTLELQEQVRIISKHGPDTVGWVTRLGPQLIPSPEAVARFHPRGQPVFPVEITIEDKDKRELHAGEVVRVIPLNEFSTVKKAYAE